MAFRALRRAGAPRGRRHDIALTVSMAGIACGSRRDGSGPIFKGREMVRVMTDTTGGLYHPIRI